MRRIRFIGRDNPLEKLKSLLNKRTSSLVVIRGRRRIGKSRLVEEFAKDLPFLSFSGLPPSENTNAQSQRDEFARQLQERLGLPGLKGDDWGDLFTLLAKQTAQGRRIILLDEITWMGSLDPNFLGKLKIAWDLYFSKNPELILILCGSVSSWIEKNIISSTGFFGRISQKIILEELKLPSCNQLLAEVGYRGSPMEKLMLLSITGGVPWYLELINPELSAGENIKRFCFEKDGILLDEFRQIFHDIFGTRSEIYQKIVRLLIDGPKEYKEISSLLTYSSGGPLSEYMNELCISGYVEKDYTWSIKTGTLSTFFRYRLGDNFLRFYLKYVEPKFEKITKGYYTNRSLGDLPGWSSIVGFQFENLVLHNRKLILKQLNINPADIIYDNPFFQRKTTKQEGCQIDYLIQTRYQTLFLCEIKFSQNSIPLSVTEEVEEKMKRLKYHKGFSCVPVLIHASDLSSQLRKSDYFLKTIDFRECLK
ncbi:MAG: hypothetical protein KR126chlam1_01258 [Chlamydiae bacterium]|nr:hypothetical protein [Chlamydiota bacterium]